MKLSKSLFFAALAIKDAARMLASVRHCCRVNKLTRHVLSVVFMLLLCAPSAAQNPPPRQPNYNANLAFSSPQARRPNPGAQDDLNWGKWVDEQRQAGGNDALADRFNRPISADIRINQPPVQNANFNPNDPNLPKGEFVEASRIIARVGSFTIIAGDLLPEINELIEANMPEAPEGIKEMQRQDALKKLTPRAVEQKLMLVAAMQQLPEKSNLDEVLKSVQESFVENELPKLLKQYKVENAHELNAVFNRFGGSLRLRQRQWAETQFIWYMVRQQINVDPEVTHQELLDDYYEHIKDYEIPAKARWQELAVRFSEFPNKDAARNAIARMGDEVVFGAPFEAVAKRHSQGFTAKDGGIHDWTSQGALKAKKLDQALFELPLNYLSDIIESEMGYHIVRVLERQESGHVSFRDAQLEIREKLKKEKQEQALKDYMAEVKKTIPVWTAFDDEIK